MEKANSVSYRLECYLPPRVPGDETVGDGESEPAAFIWLRTLDKFSLVNLINLARIPNLLIAGYSFTLAMVSRKWCETDVLILTVFPPIAEEVERVWNGAIRPSKAAAVEKRNMINGAKRLQWILQNYPANDRRIQTIQSQRHREGKIL